MSLRWLRMFILNFSSRICCLKSTNGKRARLAEIIFHRRLDKSKAISVDINGQDLNDLYFKDFWPRVLLFIRCLYPLQVQGVLKEVMSELQQTNLEKTLLAWCRQTTQVGIFSHE